MTSSRSQVVTYLTASYNYVAFKQFATFSSSLLSSVFRADFKLRTIIKYYDFPKLSRRFCKLLRERWMLARDSINLLIHNRFLWMFVHKIHLLFCSLYRRYFERERICKCISTKLMVIHSKIGNWKLGIKSVDKNQIHRTSHKIGLLTKNCIRLRQFI